MAANRSWHSVLVRPRRSGLDARRVASAAPAVLLPDVACDTVQTLALLESSRLSAGPPEEEITTDLFPGAPAHTKIATGGRRRWPRRSERAPAGLRGTIALSRSNGHHLPRLLNGRQTQLIVSSRSGSLFGKLSLPRLFATSLPTSAPLRERLTGCRYLRCTVAPDSSTIASAFASTCSTSSSDRSWSGHCPSTSAGRDQMAFRITAIAACALKALFALLRPWRSRGHAPTPPYPADSLLEVSPFTSRSCLESQLASSPADSCSVGA